MTYNYEGQGSDGSNLILDKIYMAKAIDESGYRQYIARKSGSLFAMRWWPERTHYELPQALEFMEDGK
jgi:hypothetical protein